jgi:hypothetical protein
VGEAGKGRADESASRALGNQCMRCCQRQAHYCGCNHGLCKAKSWLQMLRQLGGGVLRCFSRNTGSSFSRNVSQGGALGPVTVSYSTAARFCVIRTTHIDLSTHLPVYTLRYGMLSLLLHHPITLLSSCAHTPPPPPAQPRPTHTHTHLEVQVHNVVAVVSHVGLVTLHAQLGLTASNLGEGCQPGSSSSR